jgi:hypothetical protein
MKFFNMHITYILFFNLHITYVLFFNSVIDSIFLNHEIFMHKFLCYQFKFLKEKSPTSEKKKISGKSYKLDFFGQKKMEKPTLDQEFGLSSQDILPDKIEPRVHDNDTKNFDEASTEIIPFQNEKNKGQKLSDGKSTIRRGSESSSDEDTGKRRFVDKIKEIPSAIKSRFSLSPKANIKQHNIEKDFVGEKQDPAEEFVYLGKRDIKYSLPESKVNIMI